MTPSTITPASFEDAAAALAGASAEGRPVRFCGGRTKLEWGAATPDPALLLSTAGLASTLEHNAGDLTASFAAGVPLARAQSELAAAGQRISLDPPLGREDEALSTIGGIFATADAGPLRHRYGAPRDLILGITVALSDGTIARAGGRVIKNVAGYDLAKLFTGSFGTLGVILAVNVRLHQLPASTATASGSSAEPASLAAVALALARAPLELEALDVAWREGEGAVLAQVEGAAVARRGAQIAQVMRDHGLHNVLVTTDDEAIWARQRAGQRSREHAIVRFAARPSQLADVLRATRLVSGRLVGRAALGISYLALDPGEIGTLRVALPPGTAAVVLDLPDAARGRLDPWPQPSASALELMWSLKRRFDPPGTCNRGVFVGGI